MLTAGRGTLAVGAKVAAVGAEVGAAVGAMVIGTTAVGAPVDDGRPSVGATKVSLSSSGG